LLQTSFGAHAMSQSPQCRWSVCRLAQSPLHSVSLTRHEPTHVPLEQTSPRAHGLSHAPQLSKSLSVSTQPLPQFSVPGPQHAPPSQVSPAVHVSPPSLAHPPQLFGSVIGSVHVVPLHEIVPVP